MLVVLTDRMSGYTLHECDQQHKKEDRSEDMSGSDKVWARVDEQVCVGSGTCAMVDPAHFSLVDGKGRATNEPVERTEELDDAILDCPVQAILSGQA
ncbi:ferredoxin [Aeromicrobium wangtongii]|uniref:Ferredoxin n=1 Tax=Aeromicrobium wangtongii TaxID=2969247 RepID=A0ABY5M6E4_9ACTN|nr:ferredoxin [Aeromicrobium wangtongii]MCD9198940.1 ferredoxin [Aeromicrobium wangtongii]UUP13022.1 ferredoxin [Aeromicrobium wangtongii]